MPGFIPSLSRRRWPLPGSKFRRQSAKTSWERLCHPAAPTIDQPRSHAPEPFALAAVAGWRMALAGFGSDIATEGRTMTSSESDKTESSDQQEFSAMIESLGERPTELRHSA